jgi:putative redox protein
MKAQVKWVGEELFLGTSESGHSMVLDANNGELAPSPMESVLVSLGSCSSVDVVGILKKTKQNITGCTVELSGTRANAVPALFTDIHLNFIISGKNIATKHVTRAVTLSAEKYCSIALMLNAKVNITHSFNIIEK